MGDFTCVCVPFVCVPYAAWCGSTGAVHKTRFQGCFLSLCSPADASDASVGSNDSGDEWGLSSEEGEEVQQEEPGSEPGK